MKTFKDFLEEANPVKLAKFQGYKKGDRIKFNGEYNKDANDYPKLEGIVVNDTKGKEDVTVKLDSGKIVKISKDSVIGVI